MSIDDHLIKVYKLSANKETQNSIQATHCKYYQATLQARMNSIFKQSIEYENRIKKLTPGLIYKLDELGLVSKSEKVDIISIFTGQNVSKNAGHEPIEGGAILKYCRSKQRSYFRYITLVYWSVAGFLYRYLIWLRHFQLNYETSADESNAGLVFLKDFLKIPFFVYQEVYFHTDKLDRCVPVDSSVFFSCFNSWHIWLIFGMYSSVFYLLLYLPYIYYYGHKTITHLHRKQCKRIVMRLILLRYTRIKMIEKGVENLPYISLNDL